MSVVLAPLWAMQYNDSPTYELRDDDSIIILKIEAK